MPVVSRDMNGYRDFEQGHLRTSSYANGYDPYRRESDYPPPGRSYAGDFPTGRSGYFSRTARSEILPARSFGDQGYRRHNGVDDIEQNSFEIGMRDSNEPSFEVDHLATYTSKSGTTSPEDGLTKLKQMESSTGIWTMRCLLVIDRRNIVVIDKGNGDELERFPLSHVHEPTAVLKNDRRETYNNLVLFTIVDDPRRKSGPSDMHIFQSVNAPAQDIVDEILAAKGEGGARRGPYEKRIPPPPSGPAPEPPHGKSQNLRYLEYDRSPLETRLQETRLDDAPRLSETGRFNDASRWIHEYYTSGSKARDRTPSPMRDSWRGVQTIGYSGFPDLGNGYSHKQAYRTESYQYATPHTKAGTPFGTWSGQNYDPEKLTGKKTKKGKKWFMFSSNKNSVKKSKSGKENQGFEYSSTTLPLMRSVSSGDMYAESNSLRPRIKSDTDKEIRANLLTSDRWGIDMGDSGRGYGQSRVGDFRASYIHRDDMDTGQNEALERDVQLLNNCFDDIEKFVSRLQQAAEAYKELERRRMERGGKRKQKSAGDGMLMMRARPPPADDFIDIFQKFKFAFNLLSKLKAHIHDPNAPELVHFLFTPLSLIYEASRDPIHGGRDLSSEAVAPLLLYDAKQLLLNCLTSKELEIWQRLGMSWTKVKDEWHGSVPPYNPRFYNGWQPSPQLVDEVNQQDRLRDEPLRATEKFAPFTEPVRRDDLYSRSERRDDLYSRSERRDDLYSRSERRDEPYRMTERREDPYRVTERREDMYRSTERRDDPYARDIRNDTDYRRPERNDYNRPPSPTPARGYDPNKRASARDPVPAPPRTRAEENAAFAQDLKRMGATIYEAVHERQGKNTKELTVEKGDILQVLDKSRNWWKLKNYQGETGYAPYTILKEYQPRDDFDNNGGNRLSGDYNSYINGGAPPAPPPPTAGYNRPGSRGESDSRQREPPVELRQNRPPRMHGEKSMYSPDLHNELRNKMNTSNERVSPRGREERLSYTRDDRSLEDRSYPASSPRGNSPREPVVTSPSPRRATYISQYSPADEVRDWLEVKGFNRRCIDLLSGYNGLDLFSLERQELERLLGREDGRYLDSLLTVQKSNAGYRTRGTSELKAILQRRKERSDTRNNPGDDFGARPSFMPETPPDYSPPESEASSDDFGDAGKTLRNLLERQRKKIQQGGFYRGPYE